jgi:hypothetical protein
MAMAGAGGEEIVQAQYFGSAFPQIETALNRENAALASAPSAFNRSLSGFFSKNRRNRDKGKFF